MFLASCRCCRLCLTHIDPSQSYLIQKAPAVQIQITPIFTLRYTSPMCRTSRRNSSIAIAAISVLGQKRHSNWRKPAHMAKYYDRRHSPIKINDLVYLGLTCKSNRGYHIPDTSSLDIIKDGPFEVLAKISKNAFMPDLPPRLKTHPIIPVIHLEPATENPYQHAPIATSEVVTPPTMPCGHLT